MKKWIFIFLMFRIISCFAGEVALNAELYGINSNREEIARWLYSGKNGLIEKSNEKNGAIIGLKGNYVGIEAGLKAKCSNEESIKLKEIYVEKDWANYTVYAGKKSYLFSNPKSELSTGSLLVSNNAEAPPVLYLGTKGYIPLKWSGNKVLISASMANGILEKERVCESPYLHEKELYLKLKLNQKNSFYGGISHAALWGGEVNGKKINSGFSDFISVLLVNNTGDNGIVNEATNKIGDHKAIYEIGYEKSGENADAVFYCQHFFEDGSGKKFKNWKDMLLGINIIPKREGVISEVLMEYIYTKDQSGLGVHNVSGGNDYYYDNYIYGPWTYKDMIIGNSLFITEGSGKDIKIVHSRISGINIGIRGKLGKEWSYTGRFTATQNFGTCNDAGKEIFDKGKKEYYTILQLEKAEPFGIKESSAYMAIARDTGEIYNNTGVIIGFKKNINIY